jgi:4-amino-4-deoxy-L-arabinose transferase-like glycosyltransferase
VTHLLRHAEKLLLALIVLVYVALGVLYAVMTPPWQAPDEPAHYNYVRYLVEQRRFPILQIGDYDQAYLSEITDQKFDPALSIDPIRYEFHQPPLYYLLAAAIDAIFSGTLLPLRLLSVLLGAGVLVAAYLVGKTMYPAQGWVALGMVAFIAFIPQHIAMTAAVENDTLAELIIALVLVGLLRWLKSSAQSTMPARKLVGIGVLIGLGLLTKTTAYITVPLALITILLKYRVGKGPFDTQTAIKAIAYLLLPALVLSLPWFVRNASVYGNLDIFGLGRHEQVVIGQPRTADFIAEQGTLNLLGRWLTTMFHSFWAQFGWMAVPIDSRIYTFLRLLSGIVALGFCLWLIDFGAEKRRWQPSAILLTASGLMTLASVLWYNLNFYQAQGRYLFPALIPLGLAWIIGLDNLLSRKNALVIGIVLALATAIGGIRWIAGVCADKWRVLITGAGAGYLGACWLLPERSKEWLMAAITAPLFLICAVSPFLFIVPYLTFSAP